MYVVALGPSDKKSVNVTNEQGGTFLIQFSIVNTGNATKMRGVVQLANSATEETSLLSLPELSLLWSVHHPDNQYRTQDTPINNNDTCRTIGRFV